MTKKLGNDYRLWIESATPGTYAEIKGNTSLKINRNAELIDTSTKSDYPYGTQAPGLKSLTADATIYPDLPDTTGYGRLETIALATTQAANKFQIRKNGSSGATPGDVVFEGSMYVGNFNTDFPKNGAVQCDFQLTLAAAPVTDALA